MTSCQYAACTSPATEQVDGWEFCRHHLHEHFALQTEQADAPLPRRRWRSKHDVDPIAVELAITGRRPVKLTRAERLAAVERLRRYGLSEQAVAARLRIHPRQVTRDLVDLRERAAS